MLLTQYLKECHSGMLIVDLISRGRMTGKKSAFVILHKF